MRPKFFYGYVILALCFVNMVVMRGVNGSFSVYYLALLENFSWSHSEGASIASVNFLIYALAAPFVGLAYDRFGPRILMPLGGARRRRTPFTRFLKSRIPRTLRKSAPC